MPHRYQEGLEQTKKHLKELSKPELEALLEATGLSPQKAKIIFLKYIPEQRRWFIAEEVHCAETKVSVKTTQALLKIKHYLEYTGVLKRVTSEEPIRI